MLFLASLTLHHRPSLQMREMGATLRRALGGAGGGCAPGQHQGGGTVPVLLSKASHQEVTGCRELEAVNKTHLEGTGQGEGPWQPPPAAQGGEPLPRDAPSPAPIPHLPIHTNGMSQRGSSFRNPSPHFQSFTLALWEPGAEREDCHALPPR